MPTVTASELEGLLKLYEEQSSAFTEAEAAHHQAQTTFEKAHSAQHTARTNYLEARRSYIILCLERYEKVLCTYCKHLRGLDRMRSCREFGFYWDSDCRYNRWRTPYDNRFAICERCIPTQTYATAGEDGYRVGKELIAFDPEAYIKWLTYDNEHLEIAAKALDIPFPPL